MERRADLRYRDSLWSTMGHYERTGPHCLAYWIVRRWAREHLIGYGPHGNGQTLDDTGKAVK
jgi:hypothetical protein